MTGGFFERRDVRFKNLQFVSATKGYSLRLTTRQVGSPDATSLTLVVNQEPPEVVSRRRVQVPRGVDNLIPTLKPPLGATQRSNSGSGGFGYQEQRARVNTILPLSVAELIDHYEKQLAAGGWRKQSGGAAGLAGWSLWAFDDTNREPWHGALVAVNMPNKSHEYLMFIEIEADNLGSEQNTGGYSIASGVSIFSGFTG
jgi:hypothetical protein